MNYLKFTAIALFVASLFSCTVAETETENVENKVTADALSDADSTASMEPEMDIVEKKNALQLRAEIDDYRESIENTKGELVKGTLDLTAARGDNSQGWEKMDFYQSGDKVVRIKTYPSAEKGEKTEEFYFLNDELVFAMLENEGNKKNSEEAEGSGVSFYYQGGELIVNEDFDMVEATEEDKREMKQATKLQSEAKDYLQLVYQSKD